MGKTYEIKAKIFKEHEERYIKISKNQLRILESLYLDGSKDKKYLDSKNKLRYTEHSGLLDFGKSRLQRIIINAKQNISDKQDHTILLPDNMPDAIDFEYIFHTHPATPHPTARIIEGILYEFPSVSDLLHFIEHHNEGRTQGSLIITPEGLYIIKCLNDKNEIRINNENRLINYLQQEIDMIQDRAMEKYLDNISIKTFYKKIINDTSFINMYNELIKTINLKIFYKPRINYNNNWILDDLYLKVRPIE
tara:strand:- start:5602 stop:6351 length:750 start_codon:yes stop_codon:yes gene_type:complete